MRHKFVKVTLLLVNFVFAVLLVSVYLACLVPPIESGIFQIVGLGVYLYLIVNVVFIFIWLILKSKNFLISFLAILLTLPMLSKEFRFSVKPVQIYSGHILSVFTYNARLFNVYDWSPETDMLDSIYLKVKKMNPQIVCFQEFLDNRKIQSVKKFASLYKNFVISHRLKAYSFGQAIFSKYKIIQYGFLRLKNHKFGIWALIKTNLGKVMVINVHLRSVYFNYSDYVTIDSIRLNTKRLNSIFSKLLTGYKRRYYETEKLVEFIRNTSFPIILCGDFNETPFSYTYTNISHLLTDAYVQKGRLLSNTYRYFVPMFRIDYVFYTGNYFELLKYQRVINDFSDHYGLLVIFGKK